MAEHHLALGAATMLLLLMLVTVVYVPVVLPLALDGISVDTWAIARALLLQLVLPIVVGMVLARVLPDLVARLQPRSLNSATSRSGWCSA